MITLYDFAPAPSPRRARIFLAEKGIEHDTVQIDFMTLEQLSDDYKAINPRCSVPALKTEDGEIISENLAIATYLEALHPDNPLMGTSPLEKARVLQWNWRVEFEGLSAVADILRNSSPKMENRALPGPRNYAQIPELAARGRERLGYFYEDLNAQLGSHAYVAGDSYSLADITAMVVIDFAAWVKAKPDASLTALHAWHAKVAARPSAKA